MEKSIKTCEEYVLKQLFKKEEELAKADELIERNFNERLILQNEIQNLEEEIKVKDEYLEEKEKLLKYIISRFIKLQKSNIDDELYISSKNTILLGSHENFAWLVKAITPYLEEDEEEDDDK